MNVARCAKAVICGVDAKLLWFKEDYEYKKRYIAMLTTNVVLILCKHNGWQYHLCNSLPIQILFLVEWLV